MGKKLRKESPVASSVNVDQYSGKAFLSHSSTDKPLVSQVAAELGRECAVYDDRSFDTGYSLEDAIKDGLDRSSVYVLFASKASVGPDRGKWLIFEDEQGRTRSIAGTIYRPLCFIIDDQLAIEDLPDWLLTAKVGVANESAPKLIAHKIRQHLNDLIIERSAVPFVGRGLLTDRAKRLIRPAEASAAARTIAFYGVSGIGRRTLCREIFRDLFLLPSLHEIRIEEGDALSDLALKLADSLGAAASSAELKTLRENIESETRDEQLARCLAALKQIVTARFVPVLFDDGGILDNDGHLVSEIDELRCLATKANDIVMALILSRRLTDENILRDQAVPSIRVDALALDDTVLLISTLADKEGLSLDYKTGRALATWVRGHPPSAAHAVELIVRDGISQVIDGSQIIAYRESYFVKSLERDGALSKARQLILRSLSDYLHLPEESLVRATGLSKASYDQEVRYLLDKAFITPEPSGLYRVADPLIESIRKVFNTVTVPHSDIADGLMAFLRRLDELAGLDPENPGLRLGRLDAERLLWRAQTSLGRTDAATTIHLASDLISALRTAFRERRYEDAERHALSAIEMRPENATARSFLVRTYVRQRKYVEASEQIEAMEDRGFIRDAYYLKGYSYQHRGDHQNAVYAFRQAIHYGRNDPAVSRDLAESLFYEGEYVDAEHYAREALKREPDSRFSLDLLVRILIRRCEFAKARKVLSELQIYDDSAFFLHRKSVLELAEGNISEALKAAIAAHGERRKDASIQVQLAICYIAGGKLGEARAVVEGLSRLPPGAIDRDVVVSLQVSLANARRKFEDALLIWEKLKNKDKPQYLALRIEALNGYISTLHPTNPLRQAMVHQRDEAVDKLDGKSTEFIAVAGTYFTKIGAR